MEIDGIEIKEILEFPPAPAFGRFRDFFDRSSVAHPAKMHVELCAELIKRYTKPGDVVLDPMNGAGTTTILCMLLGRNAIGVELEETFHNWCESSRKITEEKIKEFLGALKKRPPITGWCECNPPEETYEPNMNVKSPEEVIEKFPIKIEACEKCGKPIHPKFGRVIHICGDARNLGSLLEEHKEDLPMGGVDNIQFSPPYGNRLADKELKDDKERGRMKYSASGANKSENIGNLQLREISIVIFSPPYESSVSDNKEGPLVGADERKYGRWKKGTARKNSYTQHNEPMHGKEIRQVATLPSNGRFIDCCLMSPPYEASLEGTSRHTRGGIASRDPALAQTGTYATRLSFGVPVGYSPKKDNIGNLKKETYLEAMKTVYEQCYLVLKPQGEMIIVVKPFVRNFKVVKLHKHTIKLCELVGFKLKEVLLFKLPQKSFWRVLYKKRYGDKVKDLHLLDYEWILVFESRALK